jgi:ankyrin repeat protein
VKGLNINEPGPKTGQTALHRATIKGQVAVVELLLNEFQIDLAVMDKSGKKAEEYASCNEALQSIFRSSVESVNSHS